MTDRQAINSRGRTAIVIGGGVVGLTCAHRLQARGIATTIIDPAPVRRSASWGNAGHIAVEQVAPLASYAVIRGAPRRLLHRNGGLGLPLRDVHAWLPFALRLLRASHPRRFAAGKAALAGLLARAMSAWRQMLRAAGAPDLLHEDGHFVVWETRRGAAAGRAAWASADIGTATFRDATAGELDQLSAQMAVPVAGAIRFAGSGQIADLEELARVLGASFEGSGGRQRCASARAIDVTDGIAAVRLDDGNTLCADAVIVAAGVASGRLLEPLGYKVPIVAERGYHIQSAQTDWPQALPPVVFEERSMIVTRFRSGLRAASFVEYGHGDSPADPRRWARLRSHVRALGLSFPEPGTEWMGVRPTLPDYLPVIGRSRGVPNLFYAFGHQHLGLTLAAVTADLVAALVDGEQPAVDLAPFSLARFGGKISRQAGSEDRTRRRN